MIPKGGLCCIIQNLVINFCIARCRKTLSVTSNESKYLLRNKISEKTRGMTSMETICSIYVKFFARFFTFYLALLSSKVTQLHDQKLGMQQRKRC